MPGLSLWLIPHPTTPFTKTTHELISTTIPHLFVPTSDTPLSFPPHITLTPDIDASTTLGPTDPQTWLSGLKLPDFRKEKNEVVLELDSLQAEEPFFRKLNIALAPNANLRKLAAAVRAQAVPSTSSTSAAGGDAEEWAEKQYRPHLSLFYGDTATSEVKAKIPLIEMKIGFAYGDLFACCGGALAFGGEMVLVDTRREVKEWEEEGAVLARREVEWVCWRGSRNLM